MYIILILSLNVTFIFIYICNQDATEQLKLEIVETNGDIPTQRSGHAVAAYGKFMFLYGGIDFSEEIVYNDLYTLNIGISISHYYS